MATKEYSGITVGGYGQDKTWHEPIGASGILRFGVKGEILWRFEPPIGYDMIADCYALNVAADAVWAYIYQEFPVCRIDSDGQKCVWKNEFTGARAVISDNKRVLLFGGYQGERSRCVIQDLGEGQLFNAREIELVLPLAGDIAKARLHCRGSVLHFFVGTRWYQLDLAQHDI